MRKFFKVFEIQRDSYDDEGLISFRSFEMAICPLSLTEYSTEEKAVEDIQEFGSYDSKYVVLEIVQKEI